MFDHLTSGLISTFRTLSGASDEALAIFLEKNPYNPKYQITNFLIRQEKTKEGALNFFIQCENNDYNIKAFTECSIVVFRNYTPLLNDEIFDIDVSFQTISGGVLKYPIRPTGEKYL